MKERLKTAALVLLIANAVFLAANFWVSSSLVEMRPRSLFGIYNPFYYLEDDSWEDESGENNPYSDYLFIPVKAVKTLGDGKRFVVEGNYDDLQSVSYEVREMTERALAAASFRGSRTVLLSNWEKLMCGKGLVADMGSSLPVSLYTEFISADPGCDVSSFSFRYIFISSDTNGSSVCFFDPSRLRGICIDSSVVFPELDQAPAEGRESAAKFVCELSKDYPEYENASELGLSPCQLIDESAGTDTVLEQSPANMSQDVVEIIVRAFSYNPASIRKYEDVDGSTVYVEDFGNISVAEDGTVEFSSEGYSGLSLKDYVSKRELSHVDFVHASLNLVGTIGHELVGGSDAYLRLSSLRYDEKTDTYTVSFRYTCDGYDIMTDEDPIVICISDSVIVSAKMKISSFKKTDAHIMPADQTAAMRIMRYGTEKRPINEMKLEYSDLGDGTFGLKWWAFD